jgi:hypothetical protein
VCVCECGVLWWLPLSLLPLLLPLERRMSRDLDQTEILNACCARKAEFDSGLAGCMQSGWLHARIRNSDFTDLSSDSLNINRSCMHAWSENCIQNLLFLA